MPALTMSNMTIANVQLGVNAANFGRLEGRQSHYGALNIFYSNTRGLFDQETLDAIRATAFTQTVTIPIFNKYGHTLVTVRSCNFAGQEFGLTEKAVTRFHIEFDITVTPAKFADRKVTYQSALAWQLRMAKKAVYTYLDNACAAYLDTNKDTTMVPGNYALYTAVAGAYQVPKPAAFYNNLQAIMESLDMQGPYFDITNTVALADFNTMNNPGGQTTLNTRDLLALGNITQTEFSNRISTPNRSVHFVAPVGSVGIINFIDYDFQEATNLDIADLTDEKELSEIMLWGQMSDSVFPDWKWGVLQNIQCVDQQRNYQGKCAADFALVHEFTSVTGESPIKRFDVMAAQVTF